MEVDIDDFGIESGDSTDEGIKTDLELTLLEWRITHKQCCAYAVHRGRIGINDSVYVMAHQGFGLI